MSLHSLGITEVVPLLADGQVSAEQLAADCIARIDEYDAGIQAWAWLDRDYILRQAKHCDDIRKQGGSTGRLHGIPIGLKDIIDTAGVPTECGAAMFAGRVPTKDACIVDRLKREGAIIMGKTVTAELATFSPGKTRNPHNSAHTPGGSSSGSAACVAAFMSPGAIGTQTNGSVIRPASFCGVVGYKPGYGLVPRHGILQQSPFLDQVGIFARSVEDAALLGEIMIGPHDDDPATHDIGVRPDLSGVCASEPPMPPRFALVRTAAWDRADGVTREGLEELAAALGDQVQEVELPDSFERIWDDLKTVNEAEIAAWYGGYYDRAAETFSESLRSQIESGRTIPAVTYQHSLARRQFYNSILDEWFHEFDALLTPAAPGEAPEGIDSTGDPVFCTPWTFCGTPTLTLPLLAGESGLPVGVQLVGQRSDDARLLRTARWLHNRMQGD